MQSQASEEKPSWWPALLAVVAVVHSSLSVGYAYGYTSTALEELSQLGDGYAFRLGSIPAKVFVILVPAGSLLCNLLSGTLSDQIGRRRMILLSAIPNAAGWILIATSPYLKTADPLLFKGIILTGRLLTGIACGGIYTTCPVYAAEVALPKQRGFIAALPHIFFIIGVSLAYAVGAVSAISYSHSAVFAVSIVVIYVVLATKLPESPRWLVSKGQDTHAMKVLQWLRRCSHCAQREASEIKKIIEEFPKPTFRKQLHEICKKHIYQPLAINFALSFFKYLCGYEVLLFYSSIILDSAAVSNPEATAAYSFGSVQLLVAFFSSCIVDHVGRKPLLMLGGLGTGVASGLLGTHFYITRPSLCEVKDLPSLNTSMSDYEFGSGAFPGAEQNATTDYCNQHYAPLAICSLVLFSLAYSLGFQCAVGVVKAEMVPLTVRGLVTNIIDCLGWVLVIVVSGSYPTYEQAVHPYTAWWGFSAVGLVSALFVMAFVPETKGRTLEQIEMTFRSEEEGWIKLKCALGPHDGETDAEHTDTPAGV